jgi:RND family efflux transporter MFP subunit
MRKIFIITPVLILFTGLLLAGCGNSSMEKKTELGKKKQAMEKLLKQQNDLSEKIAQLQKEITELDPSAANVKAKLVSLQTIKATTFEHFIDLQGRIDAQNVAFVAPKGQGGVVTAIYVKQGDYVRKGQALLKLDDAMFRQSVIAAEQQQGGVKAQLDQAKSVYNRQQNLWKENIGTELQVLNAKTNVESLQSQYNAAQANTRLAKEQLSNTSVRAEISGVINTLDIKIGELFGPGRQIQIVNNNDLKVIVNVPENYAGKIQLGSTLNLTLPDAGNKIITTRINVAGKLIDPVTRTFYVEGKIAADKSLRPNQVAMVRIKDYTAENAITIPVNTIQNDEKGKYVMVAATKDGKQVAKKRPIVIGELYNDQLEVKSGLKEGDIIISDGFQNLYDGQPIITTLK